MAKIVTINDIKRVAMAVELRMVWLKWGGTPMGTDAYFVGEEEVTDIIKAMDEAGLLETARSPYGGARWKAIAQFERSRKALVQGPDSR